ncbi:hypothetical protein AYL99_07961 [Fonsecaea erecta]|uniref:Dolichyl-diphosphooligosaccharide--protein glycosyltransferase subunit 4 n=1 Tax=Fonsecaea erecta TaxID=1367422 RepID=A0A178ZDH5_9EURO|nr:hypothetical protein AYL99_07961 [Fonsecaea erecta]OAP57223.1 hypothetical protein AYL99_07961 [Fonsecaea erecta]
MITDAQLYSLAIFLGSAAMLLIVLYHFLEVNAQGDDKLNGELRDEKAGVGAVKPPASIWHRLLQSETWTERRKVTTGLTADERCLRLKFSPLQGQEDRAVLPNAKRRTKTQLSTEERAEESRKDPTNITRKIREALRPLAWAYDHKRNKLQTSHELQEEEDGQSHRKDHQESNNLVGKRKAKILHPHRQT